ncbi:MAG: hypothetical protein LBO00_06230 [Zoogloeaceae bacterium]|jgi:serpin B|nr:hypothetical protein [Zoogloeaceae bacterium]
MNWRANVIFGFALVSVMGLCLSGGPVRADFRAMPEEMENADADFGFRLLRQLVRDEKGNISVAPRNLRAVFAALAAGAKGETRVEIRRVVGASLPLIDNPSGKSFRNALHLWTPLGNPLQETFRNALKDVQVESTLPEAAPDVINAYVRRHTDGKILAVMQEAPEELGIVLTAVFDFAGKWQTPFRPEDTHDGVFVTAPGKSRAAHFMRMTGKFHYASTGVGQIVRLPYREDALSMFLFLPHAANLDDWLETANASVWQEHLDALRLQTGSVSVPRFRSDATLDLIPALTALGMRRAFTRRAEFSGILRQARPLRIVRVTHGTMLAVDEQGTKTAAVTSVAAVAASTDLDSFSLQFDRPFLLAIGDMQGKTLFMAVVREP